MPQWNAFADLLRENARRMSGIRTTMSGIFGQDSASVSAPDRLNRMEEMISIMLEAVKGTKAAFVPLYALLTEEQKRWLTSLFAGRWAWVRCNDANRGAVPGCPRRTNWC